MIVVCGRAQSVRLRGDMYANRAGFGRGEGDDDTMGVSDIQ